MSLPVMFAQFIVLCLKRARRFKKCGLVFLGLIISAVVSLMSVAQIYFYVPGCSDDESSAYLAELVSSYIICCSNI